MVGRQSAVEGGMENPDGRVVEMIISFVCAKVSKDIVDYWDADDGSWVCASNY